ncbi:MAG TPA: hypothetical protein VK324_05160 [Tepidisphaeraceae bacterium]|nr:hypothetical protein [Tepidisphaeraceae bacterium]
MSDATAAPVPVPVIDALNALLEAEQSSLFRFVGEGSPYLSKATADVRRPLAGMVASNAANVQTLADLIERAGGVPSGRRTVGEEQFLAYLSLKFLLPKLVEAKELMARRYENAAKSIGPLAPADVRQALQDITAQHRADLQVLEQATAHVLSAK